MRIAILIAPLMAVGIVLGGVNPPPPQDEGSASALRPSADTNMVRLGLSPFEVHTHTSYRSKERSVKKGQ